MKQKTGQDKRARTGRTAACSRNAGSFRRAPARSAHAQAALAVLMALLHADRWVFEAGEVAKRAGMRSTVKDFHAIRLSIVKSLNKLQPLAYGPIAAAGRPRSKRAQAARASAS